MRAPSRTRRRAAGNHRTVPRERLGLQELIAKVPCAARQYGRFIGVDNINVARRSLRKLRDLGYIRPWVESMSSESRWLLTKAGAEYLAEMNGVDVATFRVRKSVTSVNWGHLDPCIELYVSLVRGGMRLGRLSPTEFLFEDAVRRRTGARKGTLVPDAVALLRTEDGSEVAIAIESDTGSESPRMLLAKAQGYARAREQGHPLLGTDLASVLCLVPSARRRNTIAKALYEDETLPEGLWFMALHADIVDERRVFRPETWWTLRTQADGETVRLVQESPFLPVISTCDLEDHRHASNPTTCNERTLSGSDDIQQSPSFGEESP